MMGRLAGKLKRKEGEMMEDNKNENVNGKNKGMRRRKGEFKMKCSFGGGGGARCRAVTGHYPWCTGEEQCRDNCGK